MPTKKIAAAILVSLGLPVAAFAATSNLANLISLVANYTNIILELLVGLAVVVFVFYIIRYFILPHDNRTEAAEYVMWSLIGFFVILSMWGLVNILIGTFNLGQNNTPTWSSLTNIFPTGSISPTTGTGSSGGSTIFNTSPSVTGTNSSVVFSTGSNSTVSTAARQQAAQVAAQQAAQAQTRATQLQSSMQSNGCYNSSGALINTGVCVSMNVQFSAASSIVSLFQSHSKCAKGDFDPSCYTGTSYSSNSSSSGCPPGDYDPTCTSTGTNSSSNTVTCPAGQIKDASSGECYDDPNPSSSNATDSSNQTYDNPGDFEPVDNPANFDPTQPSSGDNSGCVQDGFGTCQ